MRGKSGQRGFGFSQAGRPHGVSLLLSPPQPVSPEVNPVNPSAEEDEASEGGGSDGELTDVEDAFVGEEAELPKRICCESRPSKEEVELHNKTHVTSFTAAGAPTASGERPGGGTAEGGGEELKVTDRSCHLTTCGRSVRKEMVRRR